MKTFRIRYTDRESIKCKFWKIYGLQNGLNLINLGSVKAVCLEVYIFAKTRIDKRFKRMRKIFKIDLWNVKVVNLEKIHYF